MPFVCTLILIFLAVLFFLRLYAVIARVLGCVIGSEGCVGVVVLGDLGRSPRMQYHAVSLLQRQFQVVFIGYINSKLVPNLMELNESDIKLLTVRNVPFPEGGYFKSIVSHKSCVGLFSKTIIQMLALFWSLVIESPHLDSILLQTPPAIPTMLVCAAHSALFGSRLIIDWHNYGFSILALGYGHNHIIITIARLYERLFGRCSSKNLCVTKAMQRDLKDNWGIDAVTMYDKAPLTFRELSEGERMEFFQRFKEFTILLPAESGRQVSESERPRLLVSSTSWTKDEDFGVLLAALRLYNEMRDTRRANLPKLICAITGKGPEKEYYIKQIASKPLKNVSVVTMWLEPEDYPKLIGSADLGVCLHASSSGLDLPMKIVDMFGCCLPVCALDYPSIRELVTPGVNGHLFSNARELANLLVTLLEVPHYTGDHNDRGLRKLRSNLRTQSQQWRWEQEWELKCLPIVSGRV